MRTGTAQNPCIPIHPSADDEPNKTIRAFLNLVFSSPSYGQISNLKQKMNEFELKSNSQ
ncbi:hypothetical protein LguiA_007154 [Lonicera macranthoides]